MTAFERKRVRLYRVAYVEDEDREIVIVQKRGLYYYTGKVQGHQQGHYWPSDILFLVTFNTNSGNLYTSFKLVISHV